jgi:hypothetical protein
MEKNKEQLEEKVFLYQRPIYDVAEKLKKEGYSIAGHLRVRRETPTCNMIGILKDREPIQKNFLGFKYTKKQRAFHLGTVWFNRIDKNADEYKEWVFEAHGKKEMEKLTKLLEEISFTYNVRVKTNLHYNTPKREAYLHELGD